MSLDQLAGAASRELLERVPPDAERMLDDLKRTRRRRTATRYAAAAVAVVLVVGSWTLLQRDDDEPDPAEPPVVETGVIVAAPDDTGGSWRLFTSFGAELQLPRDATPFPSVAFTADGSELVYPGPQHTIKAIDVTTGSTRTLGECLDEMCYPALSPDGTRLVYGAQEHLKIQEIVTGDVRPLMTPGVQYPAMATWSPDGRTIAFTDPYGVYTVDATTERVRRLHRFPERGDLFLAPAWSPDGRTIAFLDQRPRPGSVNGESDFTVMTISTAGTGTRVLHDAGYCTCLGLPPPTLTWSPDGEVIAVAVTQSVDGAGIFTILPDGTGWQRLHGGTYGGVDWQPVVD